MSDFDRLQKQVMSYLVSIFPHKVPFYYLEKMFENQDSNIKLKIIDLINNGYISVSNERTTMLFASDKGKIQLLEDSNN